MSYPIEKKYQRRPSAWWAGRRVKLRFKIQTRSGAYLEAGRVAYVTRKYGGLDIKVDPCPHCGVGFYCMKVPFSDLVFVNPDGDWTAPTVEQERLYRDQFEK